MLKLNSMWAWIRAYFVIPDCGGHCGWLPGCGCGCSGEWPLQESKCRKHWRLAHGYALDFIYRCGNGLRPAPIDPQGRPRVAFISLYGTACGISTYNEMLLVELRKYADVRVFAEYADDNKDARLSSDPAFVTRCWDRREHPKSKLLAEIDAFNPNLVHFSHEYGFFPAAYQFTNLVSSLHLRGFPTVTTFHSVYEHHDKVVQEAATQTIVVHTESAKTVLIGKGLNADRIHVIPHGSQIFSGTADDPKLLHPLWNTWASQHVIYQPGFLFSYKGHLWMLDIVASLKPKYPDIHYVIQGSENPRMWREHARLKSAIAERVHELGLDSNVTLSTGFVHEDVILNYMRTVKVVVLPYVTHPQHDVRATSGMARIAMGTETDLIVSNVHLFDDLEGYVPRASNDAEFAYEIEKAFDGQTQNLDLRRQFLRQTSWPRVASQFAQLYRTIIG